MHCRPRAHRSRFRFLCWRGCTNSFSKVNVGSRVCEARLQFDVLDWLRSDRELSPSQGRWNFDSPRAGRNLQRDWKCEVFGHTYGPEVRPGTTLNGSTCDQPMPVRVQGWIAAWKEVNNSNIVALDRVLKQRTSGLTRTQLGRNGEVLQTEFASNWIGRLGSVQVLPCGHSVDQALFEGGYALFQIGLTLYGRRRLTLQGPDDSVLEIPMNTGDVYIGNLVPAQHFFLIPIRLSS